MAMTQLVPGGGIQVEPGPMVGLLAGTTLKIRSSESV